MQVMRERGCRVEYHCHYLTFLWSCMSTCSLESQWRYGHLSCAVYTVVYISMWQWVPPPSSYSMVVWYIRLSYIFGLLQDCVGRVCELTGCLATDVSSAVLEQSVAPPINSSLPSTPEVVAMDTVDGAVVKRYTGLISILATVGVALLAFTVWLVLKYTEDSIWLMM